MLVHARPSTNTSKPINRLLMSIHSQRVPLASALAVALTIACDVMVARLVASIFLTDCFLMICFVVSVNAE